MYRSSPWRSNLNTGYIRFGHVWHISSIERKMMNSSAPLLATWAKTRPGRVSIAPFRRQQRSWLEIGIGIYWSMILWRWFDLLTSERDDSSFPSTFFVPFLASCASFVEMHRMVLGSLALRRVATFIQSFGKIIHRGIRTYEASERVKGDNRVWQLWQTPLVLFEMLEAFKTLNGIL